MNEHHSYSTPFEAMIHSQLIPWPRKPLSGKSKGAKGAKMSNPSATKFKGHTSVKRRSS